MKVMSRIIKIIVYAIILAAIGFVLLNVDYFWKQASFLASGPEINKKAYSVDYDPRAVPEVPANTLSIPSLAITLPVKEPDGSTEAQFQTALIDGVVHYPGTAEPGKFGNVYIFGHSSDYPWSGGHYKTAFALLPSIAIGADIYLSDNSGVPFHYKVFDKRVISKTDLSVLSQDKRDQKLLTLQTSYPVGTALQRYVAIAKLVE